MQQTSDMPSTWISRTFEPIFNLPAVQSQLFPAWLPLGARQEPRSWGIVERLRSVAGRGLVGSCWIRGNFLHRRQVFAEVIGVDGADDYGADAGWLQQEAEGFRGGHRMVAKGVAAGEAFFDAHALAGFVGRVDDLAWLGSARL